MKERQFHTTRKIQHIYKTQVQQKVHTTWKYTTQGGHFGKGFRGIAPFPVLSYKKSLPKSERRHLLS